jgi:hypothetical protein
VDSASLKIADKYNISSIVSVDSFTKGTYDPLTFNLPVTYSQFAVTFTNAVPQPNYILIGSGVKLYGLGSNDKADVMIHPVYGNRTTSSFTMSVVTQGPNNFYTEVSASYSSGRTGYVTFQILSDY